MRDPDRIDKFCAELATIWKTQASDWRFGQLIDNVFSSQSKDPFFPEEAEMLEWFKSYFNMK